MKRKKWDFLLYVHAVLLLWALLFLCSALLLDDGRIVSIFATGTPLFLFVDIPFSIFSFVLNRKGFFRATYQKPITVLSVLNTLVGITAWILVIWLLQSPKFG